MATDIHVKVHAPTGDHAAIARAIGATLSGRPSKPPTDDLVRMLPVVRADLRVVRAEEGAETGLGTLYGYAAVFGIDTVIDSWEGRFVERIAPGAFAGTLAERGEQVKVLFNHGFDPSVGDKPLGKPARMEEDQKGLLVEVPLDDTSYNRDIAASLRSGALDGMSFRFSVTDESWDEPKDKAALPVRTIKGVELYEFGPVTFPAYEATSAGIRSREAYASWRTGRPTHAADRGAPPEPAVRMPFVRERLVLIARLKEATAP
jgi:hypothetical protein